jgi:hypothetical protein
MECITDPRNMRMKETICENRRIEVPSEGGWGPEGAVAPYMDGINIVRMMT